MSNTPEHFIKTALNASSVSSAEAIQSLWSGYGDIIRYTVHGSELAESVILKAIRLGEIESHPRGWSTERSHQRKLKSYQVESCWYQDWAKLCDSKSRVPLLLAHQHNESSIYLLLEDLDHQGYDRRYSQLNVKEAKVVLGWLANFHARFLQIESKSDWPDDWPEGLWSRGTYWHLATRPDEWGAMPDCELKSAATAIDEKLNNAKYQTLVHGDAKIANFCFTQNLQSVAAVDFQYVGRGIGVQDLAYFLGSCFTESQLSQTLDELLNTYFSELSQALAAQEHSDEVIHVVKQEWRHLFPIAWADFHRFLLGWSPGHRKVTMFSQSMAIKALSLL